MNNSVILIGIKRCGKTTHGKMLSDYLKVDFYDTEQTIEDLVKMPFKQYYAKNGPVQYLMMEEKACKTIAEKTDNVRSVISTGSGICDNAPALSYLRPLGEFVFLQLDIDYAVSRITSKIKKNDAGTFENCPSYVYEHKPKTLKDIQEIIFQKYNERYTQYKNISDTVVTIKNAPIEENFKLLTGAIV